MTIPTPPPSLRTVATQLWQRAAKSSNGRASLTLTRGLTIVAEVHAAERRIAFGRVDVYPSRLEVDLITRAFAIPSDYEPECHKPPETPAPWHVLEFKWTSTVLTDPLSKLTTPQEPTHV